MRRRQLLPHLWMMTDERMGDGLFPALQRLPRGAGVVFRHYSLKPAERRNLFLRVRKQARARNILLMLAGSPQTAAAWGADGCHGREATESSGAHLLRSVSIHNIAELREADRAGADFAFVSPIFATRSHPDAAPLGPLRLGLIVRETRIPLIALGGMNERRARRLSGLGIAGWAAIDAWSASQP